MITTLKKSRIFRSEKGFSLIEVCFAVAVFAVGFVAILGMLVNGIQSSRTAADNCIPAMIADDIFNEISAYYASYWWEVCYQRTGGPDSQKAIADKNGSLILDSGDGPNVGGSASYNAMFYDINGVNLSVSQSAGMDPTPPVNAYYRVYINYRTDSTVNGCTVPAVKNPSYQVQAYVTVIWPAAKTATTVLHSNVFFGQIARKYSVGP